MSNTNRCLFKVCRHIDSILEDMKEDKARDWRSHLWYFVSNFTEYDAKKLFKLYRHAIKKDTSSQDGRESSQEKEEKKDKHHKKKHSQKETERHKDREGRKSQDSERDNHRSPQESVERKEIIAPPRQDNLGYSASVDQAEKAGASGGQTYYNGERRDGYRGGRGGYDRGGYSNHHYHGQAGYGGRGRRGYRQEEDHGKAIAVKEDYIQMGASRSGWSRHSWQVLRGGGDHDINANEEIKGKAEKYKQSSVSRKRKVETEFIESPTQRKLITDYKQKSLKRSPLKTSKRRKIPRLKCINASCRVGFSSLKAKIHHERFKCSVITHDHDASTLSPVSPSVSSNDEKECCICGAIFAASRSRVRHERDAHKIFRSGVSSNSCSSYSDSSSRDVSPVSSSGWLGNL